MIVPKTSKATTDAVKMANNSPVRILSKIVMLHHATGRDRVDVA